MAELMSAASVRAIAIPARRRAMAESHLRAEGGLMDRILEAARCGCLVVRYEVARFDLAQVDPCIELLVELGYVVIEDERDEEHAVLDVRWE